MTIDDSLDFSSSIAPTIGGLEIDPDHSPVRRNAVSSALCPLGETIDPVAIAEFSVRPFYALSRAHLRPALCYP